MEHANYAKKLCWKGRSYIVHITIYQEPNIEKLFFDSTVIDLTERVRDLGVILDKNLRLIYHINETCRKETIGSIGRIRKYLTNGNLKLLFNALVILRLNYCKSILYSLPKQELDRLQRIQNTAARLITKTKQYELINPALRELHWLPVESRLVFKVIHITLIRFLTDFFSLYLSSLLQEYHPPRSLRPSSKSLFTVPTHTVNVSFPSVLLHYRILFPTLFKMQTVLNLPWKHSYFGNFVFDYIF